MKYWTKENQEGIIEYLSATTQTQRNNIFTTKLYASILLLIRTSLYRYNQNCSDDDVQELLMFIVEKVLPKIDPLKVKATHQLIWIAVNNRIISNYNDKSIRGIKTVICNDDDKLDYFNETVDNEYDIDEELKHKRLQILKELDRKIDEQKVLNKTNTIYLILLRQYAIENEYDMSGFRDYCCETMAISVGAFWNVSSTLGIKSKTFHIAETKQSKAKHDEYNR